MKKIFCISFVFILAVSMSACFGKNGEEAVQTEANIEINQTNTEDINLEQTSAEGTESETDSTQTENSDKNLEGIDLSLHTLSPSEYWCMGKSNTCKHKTNSYTDLYCDICDPDGDNIEGDLSEGKKYWCMGKKGACDNKVDYIWDIYCDECDPDNDNVLG